MTLSRGRIIRVAVSLGIVALVLWLTDARAAMARLAGADPGWLAIAGALLTAQTMLMALRWRLTAARLGLFIGRRRAVGEYYLAQIVNTTLPGGVLGDAARAFRSRGDAGFAAAAYAVMLERMAGQVAMLTVTILGFGAALAQPGGIPWPGWTWMALAGAIGALALVLLAAAPTVRTSSAMAGFARAARIALLVPDVLPRQVALGAAIVAINLMAFAACARATGTILGPEAIATLVPLILTAMVIPLSVAGLGWREGAAAALFPLVGTSPEAGVAAGLAFGAVMLVASLPGLLWPAIDRTPGLVLPPGRAGH